MPSKLRAILPSRLPFFLLPLACGGGGTRSVTEGVFLLLLFPLLLAGCVERQIRVTSNPAGARVWLNDQEIGTTPCDARFTFYGGYDIRLEKPGYEAVHELRTAHAPLHEYPGVDLLATAAPGTISNIIEWHFDLEQIAEHSADPETALEDLLTRATDTRDQANTPSPD